MQRNVEIVRASKEPANGVQMLAKRRLDLAAHLIENVPFWTRLHVFNGLQLR